MLAILLLPALKIIVGFVLLIWGADRFVIGAAATAKHLGVTPLIIGLIVVGFGTSAPEMMVSGIAAWQNRSSIAIGNALGSNITNIGLILGATALLLPISVTSQIIRRELPLLLLVSTAVGILLLDNHLGRLDGMLMLLGIAAVLFWLARAALQQRRNGLAAHLVTDIPQDMSLGKACFWLLIGIVVLLGSAQILVQGAVSIAQLFGISELVIGLTVIAIGTSLPELAASLTAAYRRQHDIAIGNVIGSNLFNLLVVLALPGLIRPELLPAGARLRDLPVMLAFTFLLFIFAYSYAQRAGRINRIEGALLLSGFLGYQMLLYSSLAPAT